MPVASSCEHRACRYNNMHMRIHDHLSRAPNCVRRTHLCRKQQAEQSANIVVDSKHFQAKAPKGSGLSSEDSLGRDQEIVKSAGFGEVTDQ